MNGLVTSGGTSKYMTYRLTTSVPSFRALWTCPWPISYAPVGDRRTIWIPPRINSIRLAHTTAAARAGLDLPEALVDLIPTPPSDGPMAVVRPLVGSPPLRAGSFGCAAEQAGSTPCPSEDRSVRTPPSGSAPLVPPPKPLPRANIDHERNTVDVEDPQEVALIDPAVPLFPPGAQPHAETTCGRNERSTVRGEPSAPCTCQRSHRP